MISYILSIIVVFISSVVNGFPDRLVKGLPALYCTNGGKFKSSVNHGTPDIKQEKQQEDSYKLYKREEWGALPSVGVVPLNTPVPYVVIHHTYIPGACNTTQECKEGMRSMQNYHNSLGWGDIGYNFCIGSEAGVYEGRGFEGKGIHAGKANGVSIGICLIGDWRTELPPQIQLDAVKALIKTGINKGYIRPDYKLVGHRQVMATECPGGALYQHISTWKHFVPEFEEAKN